MGAGCSSDSSVDISHTNTRDGSLSIVPVSRTPQDKTTSIPTPKSTISPLLKAKSQKLLHPSPTETAAEDKKIIASIAPPTAPTSVQTSAQTSAIKSPLSSTSKLDLHDVIHERDLDHERTQILNQTLRCHNCEDVNAPITSWCDTCPPPDTSPPILCSTCTHAMHKSSKTSSHIRYPFMIHMGNMPTAQELGFVGTMLPPGLPPLGAIACQNCETTQEVSVWCSECHGFYCQPCGRDLHKPKNMSRHVRHPCTYRFIHAQHRGLSAAITETKTSSPIIPISGTTSTSKSIHIPMSHINDSKEQEDQVMELKASGKRIKTRNAKSTKSTEINDIVPVENGGIAGDIYSLAEITITGTLNMDQLQFRNVINPYDTIGDVMITHVVCGAQHTGAITALGSLFMWGSNHDHQLGVDLGDEKETRIPQLVIFERHNPVKQIALGTVHSVALCQTGDVYTWGSGIVGILGHETDADRTRPTRLEFLDQDEIHTISSTSTSTSTSHVEEVVMIAAAHYNTGVVVKNRKDQAQLYIWGEGQSGVIGDGQQKPHLQPCLIRIEQDNTYPIITQLALGARHAVAITQDGAVYSWGSNEYGQLGQNTPSDSNLILTPQRIPYLTVHGIAARHVVCGERHTSILSTAGDVWSWGSGETHQLGIFDNVDQFTPVKAQGLGGTATAPITTIITGASLSAAITETGEVYMWGWGVETPIPKLVEGLHGYFIQHIAISDHISILTGCNTEVWELAYNEMEDDIEDVSQRVIPRAVPNKWLRGKRLKCISVGTHHTGIVTQDGKLYMWGSNADMQLGLGNDSMITEMPTPMEIKIKYKIATLACGAEHNVALTTTGQVVLGHKSGNNCGEPTLVATLASIPCSTVACGATNSAAITRDGQLYIWGAGGSGQIGNGDVMPAFTPTHVTSLSNEKCIAISFGLQHVAVLTEKKQIWTWGDNRFGQLSQGLGFDDESSPHPLLVSHLIPLGITPISVSCGDNVTLIVTSLGTCYGWGSGETHQLCTDDSEDVRSPIVLNFPKHATKKKVPKIVQLSSHGINCAARSDDGDVYCWGWEFGAQPRLLPPMDPDKPSPCTDLVMGSTHLLAST